jgi:hypothetical protein
MDMQLAEYKAGRQMFVDPKPPIQNLFPRRRITTIAQNRTTLDLIAKQMRDATWRRHESHEKQLKHFLDRERFQQNQTWQSEYDRLAAIPAPGLQPFVNARLESLKTLLIVK